MALRSGRLLLSLIALVTITGPYIADWNHTHVFNSNWPPHAKFHNGQTMSMGLSLGLATLYYLWAPLSLPKHISPSSAKPTDRETIKIAEKRNLGIVTVLASMYWVTQLSAILYPGSKATDPEFGDGFPQLWIDLGCFVTIGAGYHLENGRIASL